MCPLSSNTRSSCNSSAQCEDPSFKPIIGWTSSSLQIDSEIIQQKIIQTANEKISLKTIFDKYNISFEETYSSTGWIYKRNCPFDDHIDKSPSFGYNPRENIFNCFGCHRGGKAVEFISYKEHKDKLIVAKNLLKANGITSYSDIVLESFDYERFQKILFDYADYVRSFKNNHNSITANKYAKDINWVLDIYLIKNDLINLESLEFLISKLKQQFELFEE